MPRLSEQYVSGSELNSIQGLVHYLNTALPVDGSNMAAEVVLTDTNGERVGVIKVPEGPEAVGAGYSFCFLIEDPS